jgi:AraC-like DNA-binding protein
LGFVFNVLPESKAVHSIQFSKPSDATERFILFYGHRESSLGASVLIHPVPARSEHVLDFQFADEIQIHDLHDGIKRSAKSAALIGLQTHRRVEQVIRGRIESFSVFLQPAALSLLFGLPAIVVTNTDLDAHGVLGRFVGGLRERLGNCGSFLERVRVAEEFFIDLSSKTPRFDLVESVAHEIRRQHGVCQVEAVARSAGLSSRTLHRRFKQSIGLSPKIFARIVRFESALQTKATSPKLTWTDIAHEYGYHDQMHMVHDFHSLSTDTPSGLLRHLENMFSGDFSTVEKTHILL